MDITDHYAMLGVPRSASFEEIQAAYRRQAKEWHPDRNKRHDATARFRAISDAYQCLKDPAKRFAYGLELDAAEAAMPLWQQLWRGRGWSAPSDGLNALIARHLVTRDTLVTAFERLDAWLRFAYQR